MFIFAQELQCGVAVLHLPAANQLSQNVLPSIYFRLYAASTKRSINLFVIIYSRQYIGIPVRACWRFVYSSCERFTVRLIVNKNKRDLFKTRAEFRCVL